MSDREEIRQRKAEEMRDHFEGEHTESGTGTETGSPGAPVDITGPDHMETFVAEQDVVLADFYADWCGPCKMIEPVVEEVAAETDAAVAKVDVDARQRLARQYGVQGVPTLSLFADGQPVEELVGVTQKHELLSLVEQYA